MPSTPHGSPTMDMHMCPVHRYCSACKRKQRQLWYSSIVSQARQKSNINTHNSSTNTHKCGVCSDTWENACPAATVASKLHLKTAPPSVPTKQLPGCCSRPCWDIAMHVPPHNTILRVSGCCHINSKLQHNTHSQQKLLKTPLRLFG